MACDCIDRLNDALADDELASNTQIVKAHIWRSNEPSYSAVRVSIEKRDTKSRKRAVPVFPTFCPFCGERYV